MNRKHVALWLVGLVLVSTGAFAATTLTAETRGTVPVGASGGPMAGVQADRADLTNFSINQSAARITTSDGEIVIDGQDDAYARIDRYQGAWTNVSDVDTNGGSIRMDPADKQFVEVSGGMEAVAWRPTSATALDDGQVDVVFNASSSASVRIRGLPADTDIAAVTDTERPRVLSTATTDASGRATLAGLSGDHEARLISAPDTLEIRNESRPSELVDGTQTTPKTVHITIYLGDDASGQQIYNTTTTTGTINMTKVIDTTGLTIDEDFVVAADAEGYHARRIYVESLAQQGTIYLLPESKPSVRKLYTLTDYTGLYPQDESVLKIQRGLNGSWETVQGDYFGASGEFEAILREEERHRLVILNTVTDRRRVLGTVTPLTSATQQIEVNSRDDIELSRLGPIPSVLPSTRALPAAETDVTVGVDPLRSDLVEWNYTIVLTSPYKLNKVLASNTLSTGGTESPSFNLTGEAASSIIVRVGWETADGRSMVTTESFRIVKSYEGYSLLDGLFAFPTLFTFDEDASAATSMIALLFSVFGAAATGLKFRASTEGIGLVATGLLAVFAVIGWIGYAVVFAAGVGWVALVALRRGL